jgi:putative mRNA 3-end processing factor
VFLHGAIAAGVDVYRRAGIGMADTRLVMEDGGKSAAAGTGFAGELILAPPSAAGSAWLRRFRKAQHGFASGWMRLRGNRRRRNMDRGFVVSDHADWPDLLRTIHETGARRVIATHGDTDALVRTLNEGGVAAETLATQYGEDD